MRLFSYFLSALALRAHHVIASKENPLRPSEDPFYTPSVDNWESSKAGTVLDSREVRIGSIVPQFPFYSKAYQLLYVTRNVSDLPATTVTTVIIPHDAKLDRLLTYQIAYDAPDINCSPSYGLQRHADSAAAYLNRFQMSFIFPYLQGGPVLNIPDYEGSNAAFTVGPQSGYQTLDSIRAVQNFRDEIGLSKNANTIMFGYSGGGFATEWASELHSNYSSELPITGAVIGGPPPNITNTYISVNGTKLSTLNVWAMLGVMNSYPQIDDYMRKHLLDDWKEPFLARLRRCSRRKDEKPPLSLKRMNISSLFDNGDQFLYEFKDILNDIGVMGKHTAPKFPVYIYQGTADDVTPPFEDTVALVNKFCEAGTQVTLVEYENRDHLETLLHGTRPAWDWITSKFEEAEGLTSHVNNETPVQVPKARKHECNMGTRHLEEVGSSDASTYRGEL